ncbi:MAG: Rv1355c family protein [Cytophagaceae bacterium]|nr:Rv1355c family protein [Cytophagaceae bacterium]
MAIFLQTKINTLNYQQKDQQEAFKPLFYRISNIKDREDLSLVLDKPGLMIHDYLFDQVKELMKISSPNLRLTSIEQEEAALRHINSFPMEEYGVWVYYSWSNRLVHIVDEKEFIELRTSRNQYKITPEERDLLAQKKIGVIGLSVGQSVAITLAMERIAGEIRLADFDVLELTNLNRIRTGIHNLGLPKVYAVAREIAEIDPFIIVKCFSKGITEDNMTDFLMESGKLDLILEESDSLDIKVLSRYKAKELGIPVVMESSDRCMVDVERFDLEPSRKVLHGLIETLDLTTLKSLKTNEEKIPYALAILGADTLSPRLKASMNEIGKSITTWPQLASAVTMGGGIAADVSRRLLLDQFTSSGRYYVDVETIISDSSSHMQDPSKNEIQLKKFTMEEMNHLIDQIYSAKNAHSIEDHYLQQLAEASMKGISSITFLTCVPKNYALYLFQENLNTSFSPEDQTTAFSALGTSLQNISITAQQMQLSPIIQLYPLHNNHRLIAKITFASSYKK